MMMRHLSTVVVVVAGMLGTGAAGQAMQAGADPLPEADIHVTASSSECDAHVDQVSPGYVSIGLENLGESTQQLYVADLFPGQVPEQLTSDELRQQLRGGLQIPANFDAGDVRLIVPLDEGEILLLCADPAAGIGLQIGDGSRVDRVAVLAGTSGDESPDISANDVVRVGDFGPLLPATSFASQQVWEIVNDGKEPLGLTFAAPPPGASLPEIYQDLFAGGLGANQSQTVGQIDRSQFADAAGVLAIPGATGLFPLVQFWVQAPGIYAVATPPLDDSTASSAADYIDLLVCSTTGDCVSCAQMGSQACQEVAESVAGG